MCNCNGQLCFVGKTFCHMFMFVGMSAYEVTISASYLCVDAWLNLKILLSKIGPQSAKYWTLALEMPSHTCEAAFHPLQLSTYTVRCLSIYAYCLDQSAECCTEWVSYPCDHPIQSTTQSSGPLMPPGKLDGIALKTMGSLEKMSLKFTLQWQ